MIEIVFQLVCEDAISAGGPMGSERPRILWTRLHYTLAGAKARAEAFVKKAGDWRGNAQEYSWDAGAYLFTIRRRSIGK
jgi:hypothetical protein